MKNLETSGKPSSRSEEGLLNSAASSRPRSIAGTISPPGRMVTAAPISLNRSAERPTVRYFMPLKSSPRLDLLLEPAERLGRHREIEEADEIELQDVVDELLVERLAAAVVEPAEQAVRVPAEGGRRAEQRIGLVLAVPVGADAVTAIENAGMHRVGHLEGRHDRAGRQHVELEAAARHVVDLLGVVDRELVEDVLGRPGRLILPGHRLRARDLRHGDRAGGRRAGGNSAGLQELAAGNRTAFLGSSNNLLLRRFLEL